MSGGGDSQDRFFAAVADRRLVRPSVRAIVQSERGYLVQRPTDNVQCNYAFLGGEYEWGDSFASRLAREFEEETNARLLRADYRFVVENRFLSGGQLIHGLEHYFEVEIDRLDVQSREAGLEQLWLAPQDFARADVRPRTVRDVLQRANWRDIRWLEVEDPRC